MLDKRYVVTRHEHHLAGAACECGGRDRVSLLDQYRLIGNRQRNKRIFNKRRSCGIVVRGYFWVFLYIYFF